MYLCVLPLSQHNESSLGHRVTRLEQKKWEFQYGGQDRKTEGPKVQSGMKYSKASVGRNVSCLDLPKGAAWFLKGVNSPFVTGKVKNSPFCCGRTK